MSDYSGFSSASRMEIERLKAVLVANGINDGSSQGTSAQARAQDQARTWGQARTQPSNSAVPNRKRQHSQQLGPVSKDARVHEVWQREQGVHLDQPILSAQSSHVHTQAQVKGAFNISNDRQMRQEIEIALESMNGEIFRGSITRPEAKFGIYKECLGFSDFSNFDGARFGFKGCPIIIFKLIEPINVDDLYDVQHFQFRRKTSRQGRTHVDVIKCKIRGIRPPGLTNVREAVSVAESMDDGIRIIKLDGCDYRIPEDTLVEFLSFFGSIESEIMEDLFDDGLPPGPTCGGINRTGTYSVKIKLQSDIPQILPIMGRRIRVHYRGIQKLCPNCFGPHPKAVCKSFKVAWREYIETFMKSHARIPADLFGNWINTVDKTMGVIQGPKPFAPDQNATVSDQTNMSLGETPMEVAVDPVNCTEKTVTQPASSQSQPTGNWTKINPVSNRRSGSTLNPPQVNHNMDLASQNISDVQIDKTKGNEPKREDFLVPQSKAEHDKIVDRLITGGSTLSEAEQIIAARKTAFNKALKEFKKGYQDSKPTTTGKRGPKALKSNTNTSRRVNSTSDEYAN